jgi:aspartate aminotransferase
MLETLTAFPADPILGLISAYAEDPNPRKVDLGAGVYKDEAGNTPILDIVKQAERIRWETETTKTYFAQAGNPLFNEQVQALIFGDGNKACAERRVQTVQTPGGSGAVKLGAILLGLAKPGGTIWVSEPTWNNHAALLSHSDLIVKEYPYYDRAAHRVSFDAMQAALERAAPGDSVLLHGCCHNPTGADPDESQWRAIAALIARRGLFPYVDLAYHGLAQGLDTDARGVRLLSETVPEMLVAYSCSKNFGLYRERVGAVSVVGRNPQETSRAFGQVLGIARRLYSVPPSHGQAIVGIILSRPDFRAAWINELGAMRKRLNSIRARLSEALAARSRKRDFAFVAKQYGLFSLLGLSAEQVQRLRTEFSIYMVSSSRINVAGINSGNLDYLADSIAAVL